MKPIFGLIIGVLIGMAIIKLFTLFVSGPWVKRVDCAYASFHPDYTQQIRQQCRGVKQS